MSGTLFDGTAPLKNEYVILGIGAYRPFAENGAVNCRNVEAITKTDDAGHFEFQAVNEMVTVQNPWEYPAGAYWSVCIERDGVRRAILGQFGRTGQVPSALRVRCDIAGKAETIIEADPPIKGFCNAALP